MIKIRVSFTLGLISVGLLLLLPISGFAIDHLIAITHQNDVNKKITIYEPDGTLLFSHTPEGLFDENIPTWMVSVPSAHRLFVSCPNEHEHEHEKNVKHEHDHETEGLVEVIDYSTYPGLPGHIDSLHTGNIPFHLYLAPDQRVVVSNDEDGTISYIEPASLHIDTVTGGFHHGTIVFAGAGPSYNTYVGQFHGESEPGAVDIIDSSGNLRVTINSLLPNPHSGVYSPVTKRVYFACMGGLEVIGTEGVETDQHLGTLPLPVEGVEAEIKISPDGTRIYGNIYHEEPAPEKGYFYSYDILSGTTEGIVPSVNCTDFGLSPDGKWIVAGDLLLTGGDLTHRVHVIDVDPVSPTFMSIRKEIPLGLPVPTRVGFSGVRFSPDGKFAYVALTERNQVMVIDMTTLDTTTFQVEPAPWFLHVLTVNESSFIPSTVEGWNLYQ